MTAPMEMLKELLPPPIDGTADHQVTLPNGKSFVLEKEYLQHCLQVAQAVSPNPNLKIIIGDPGGGSFKLLGTDYIVLDPLLLHESVSKGRFVTGHEAAHDAISRSMVEIGLSEAQMLELGRKPGYQYIHNILEDPVVNDFQAARVRQLRVDTVHFYDEQFKKENAAMMTPEAASFAQALGYVPKYVQFGSEIMRDWHTGLYSKKLDSDVAKVLPMVIGKAREIIKTFPRDGVLVEKDIIDFARRRFLLVHEYIWPEVEKLVKLDIDNERRRQQANQSKKGGDGSRSSGQGGGSTPGSKGVPQPGQGGTPSQQRIPPSLSPSTQQEIDKLRDDASREQGQRAGDRAKELKDRIRESEDRQRELEKETGQAGGSGEPRTTPEQKTSPATANADDFPEQREKSAGEKLEQEHLKQEALEKELEKTLEDAVGDKDAAKKLEKLLEEDPKRFERELEDAVRRANADKDDAPFDPTQLSPKAQRELDRLFRELPDGEREKHEDLAREALKEIENRVNQRLNPSQVPVKSPQTPVPASAPPPTQSSKGPSGGRPAQMPDFSDIDRVVNELEDQRLASLPEWDREFERVGGEVEGMYHRIQRELLKERYPEWDPYHPVGQQLDNFTAMQSEADPSLLTQLYMNRLLPTEKDWAVEIVVDTSPSMSGVARVTFQAIVFLTELLHRLKVDSEISEFAAEPLLHKRWGDTILDDDLRQRLSKFLEASGGSTLDGTALSDAYDRISQHRAKRKIIMVFSDADSLEARKLCNTIDRIKEDGDTIVVHFGVGPGTFDSNGYYPFSFGELNLKNGAATTGSNPAAEPSASPPPVSHERPVSPERAAGDAVANPESYTTFVDEPNTIAPSSKDFYETLFETTVDIMLDPEKYLKQAKAHVPGKGRRWVVDQ